MKRLLIALGLLLVVTPAVAATLTDGSTINRVWQMTNNTGQTGLKIVGSAKSTALQSSGSLLVSSGAGLTALWVDAYNRLVGVRTRSPKAELDVNGAMSGNSLYVTRAFSGAGLSSCSNGTTSKLLWNASTGRFSCGTDQTGGTGFGTGQVITTGDARYVKKAGDTMTGILVIQNGNTPTASATPLLNARGTMSGRSVYISGTGSAPLLNTAGGGIAIGAVNPLSRLFVTGGAGAFQGLIVQTDGAAQYRARSTSHTDRELRFQVFSDGITYFGPQMLSGGGAAHLVIRTGADGTAENSGEIRFSPRNTQQMVITNSGSVGIGRGLTTPGSRLSVSGSVILGNNLGTAAADAGLALEIIGSASGRVNSVN